MADYYGPAELEVEMLREKLYKLIAELNPTYNDFFRTTLTPENAQALMSVFQEAEAMLV